VRVDPLAFANLRADVGEGCSGDFDELCDQELSTAEATNRRLSAKIGYSVPSRQPNPFRERVRLKEGARRDGECSCNGQCDRQPYRPSLMVFDKSSKVMRAAAGEAKPRPSRPIKSELNGTIWVDACIHAPRVAMQLAVGSATLAACRDPRSKRLLRICFTPGLPNREAKMTFSLLLLSKPARLQPSLG